MGFRLGDCSVRIKGYLSILFLFLVSLQLLLTENKLLIDKSIILHDFCNVSILWRVTKIKVY